MSAINNNTTPLIIEKMVMAHINDKLNAFKRARREYNNATKQFEKIEDNKTKNILTTDLLNFKMPKIQISNKISKDKALEYTMIDKLLDANYKMAKQELRNKMQLEEIERKKLLYDLEFSEQKLMEDITNKFKELLSEDSIKLYYIILKNGMKDIGEKQDNPIAPAASAIVVDAMEIEVNNNNMNNNLNDIIKKLEKQVNNLQIQINKTTIGNVIKNGKGQRSRSNSVTSAKSSTSTNKKQQQQLERQNRQQQQQKQAAGRGRGNSGRGNRQRSISPNNRKSSSWRK